MAHLFIVVSRFPIHLAAMTSRTNALSDILRNSEHLKSLLPKQKPLPIDDSTLTPLSIPPLQLPSADSILSNFRSSLPAKLLDRCTSTLIESAEVVQRNYEMTYHALYSSPSPTQDRKAEKLRYTREQVYHCTIIRPMQNLLVLAQQRTMKINSEIRDSSESKLRTRFRQVRDKLCYPLCLLISRRNMSHTLNGASSRMHIHLILKGRTLLVRQKCRNVKLKFGLDNSALDQLPIC